MGSPATVTPGRLLVSPSGPEKDRLWGQVRILTHRACHSSREEGMTGTQPPRHDTTAGPRRVVVVVVRAFTDSAYVDKTLG